MTERLEQHPCEFVVSGRVQDGRAPALLERLRAALETVGVRDLDVMVTETWGFTAGAPHGSLTLTTRAPGVTPVQVPRALTAA